MRAFIAIKHRNQSENRSLVESLSQAFEQAGFETVCVQRDIEEWGRRTYSPETLMAKTFREIDASDVLMIDLAEKGVGIGIEAGYAFALNKPIVTIAPRAAQISPTLRGISNQVLFYEHHEDLDALVDAVVRWAQTDLVHNPAGGEQGCGEKQ